MKILHVFTLLTTAQTFFDGQFKYISEKGNFELHLASDSQEDIKFTEKNGLTYHRIKLARKISPFADLKSIIQLYRLIRKEKFDGVIGHTPKGALIAMITSYLSGTKKRIYYRHGLIYTTSKGYKKWIFKLIERFTALLSTNIINVSSSLSTLAITEKLNSGKKQYLFGNGTCGGIDTKISFNPENINKNKLDQLRQQLNIKKNDFIIGFCGRICTDKGIKELIDGYYLFKQAHSDIHTKLLLVGEYDSRDILPNNYLVKIEVDLSIIKTGFIPKEEIPLYYSLMDIFVFPSYREGFGMSVLEAGAMCKPSLVSRSHGAIDSIAEQISGEYIEIDPESIAKGLENMLDPGKRSSMGLSARQYVCNKFDYSELWPVILKYYRLIFKN